MLSVLNGYLHKLQHNALRALLYLVFDNTYDSIYAVNFERETHLKTTVIMNYTQNYGFTIRIFNQIRKINFVFLILNRFTIKKLHFFNFKSVKRSSTTRDETENENKKLHLGKMKPLNVISRASSLHQDYLHL